MLQFCMKLLSRLLLALIPVCVHAQSASSGTVPFVLDGNRVYARVEFILPDGKPRNALVFVDLGSPAVTLSKKLYADLDLGSRKTLELRIGEMDLILEFANVSGDDTLPFSIGEDRTVEGVLPAGVLQNYQVRFDYAGQTMTALVRIPAMKLGSLSVRQVGALAIAPDDQGPDFILFPREKRRPRVATPTTSKNSAGLAQEWWGTPLPRLDSV